MNKGQTEQVSELLYLGDKECLWMLIKHLSLKGRESEKEVIF